MGGKEVVTFKLVRAENVYGFNGEGRDPLRKSKIEAKVMMRDKKEMEVLCRVGGDCGGQARGGSWYNTMELQGSVILVLW